MENDLTGIEPEQLQKVIGLLSDCTDAYLFTYNLTTDYFSISTKIVNKFNLPGSNFENASLVLCNIISPEDVPRFYKEGEKLLSGHSVEHAIEYRLIDKNNNIVWLSSRGRVVLDAERNQRLLVGRVTFIGQRMIGDNLTGFITDLQLAEDYRIALQKKGKVSGFIMKIDVDNLGQINEQYGSIAGDNVLKTLAECCRRVVTPETSVYRSQSDEIIFMNVSGKIKDEDGHMFAEHMYAGIKREISNEEVKSGYEIMFTVSAGTVAFFQDATPLEELMRKIDYTLVQAKNSGRNMNKLFDAVSYNQHLRALELQTHFRYAVKHEYEGFQLNFQPVVNAQTKKLIGAEALLRWSSDDIGTVVPDEFIPLLEQTGLIIPVGRWVLLTAFAQCAEWNREMPDFRMSVNLSYVQIKKSDVLTDVQMALEKTGVNPKNIVLEITESGYVGGDDSLPQLTASFSAMGIHIDIDDFGTGYSNLRYLQYLHADTLKLDYTFTNKAVHNEYDRNVIKHIIAMAHSIKMTVCMEGIEFASEEKILSVLGPDTYQGYLFGRPTDSLRFYDQHLMPFLTNHKIELLDSSDLEK